MKTHCHSYDLSASGGRQESHKKKIILKQTTMKNLKITTIVIFLLGVTCVNAQFTAPKNKKATNLELKKGIKTDLTYNLNPIDGIIGERIDGRYQIYWTKNSGVYCCAKTVKEALNAYPQKNLRYVASGNQGYVYEETSNGGIGKKIPNAHIAFKNVKNSVVHYAHTNKYGNYKIALLPGKYIVRITHKGYKLYTTAPGFSIIYNNYKTFNIPLQRKFLEYPIKNNDYNIITVFNTKTKKLIDVVLLDKNKKPKLKKRSNTAMFYGKITGSKIVKNSFEKLSKGNSLIVFLNKKYLPGDQFIPGDQFLPGDQFILNNTKLKVVSNIKKVLKMVVL